MSSKSRAAPAVGLPRPDASQRARWRRPLTALALAAAAGALLVVLLARPHGGAIGLTTILRSDVAVAKQASQAAVWQVREVTGTAPKQASARQQGGAAASRDAAQQLEVKVLSVRPHDPAAYTQGLVWDHGTLYESTGLYGQSSLRAVDPRTGEVKRRLDVPQGFFAEGLAQVGSRLVQLTWKEGVAFVYDLRSFERVGEYQYEGEGWGLCNDGRRLVMSDGSDRLSFRDLKTFALLGGVGVRRGGSAVHELNELECVDGSVYANVWMTDEILRIDPANGAVTAVIDARGLLSAGELAHADVLNGIAYDPAKKTFLITGKLWPKMFEVVFVPAAR